MTIVSTLATPTTPRVPTARHRPVRHRLYE
jgi:hypothetical protein